jgi:tRNA nucleotidyltransferase/poly(A) polymerase
MPDYIYLLENRLSADQRHALRQLREAAREAEMILFLTGDAVRDLTSGHAVRDLEVAVHGNALKLKKPIQHLGGTVWGESESTRTLYLCFPGTVRVDVVSTHRMDYTNLSKPVYHAASIQEDLRRRDFTVNAMAISLNEGSFGLLMDPLNGAADIEARALRLVSNYGFLEEPSLLIRATRYMTRLGWEMDAKTRTRYDNAKGDGVIENLSAEARSRELEQIGHEDEGLKVLHALEDEGWMKVLFPAWTAAKADEEKLKALHDLAVELLLQGVHADMSAAQMQLLTAKLAAKELAALKQLMLRPGFVEEWNSLDALAAKFAKVLLAKENATPSAAFKLFTSYDPEAVLWLGFTSKDKAIQERFNNFLKVWPEARQRIPHALLQELRITPELDTYAEIVHSLFLELIDGRLTTPEDLRAFLEPHSPPAPPPQVTVKRPRAKRGEAKVKERSYDDDEESEDALDEDEDGDDLGGDDDEIDLGLNLPKVDIDADVVDDVEPDAADDDLEADEADSEPEEEAPAAKRGNKAAAKSGKEPAPQKKNETVKAEKETKPSPKASHSVPHSKSSAVVSKASSPAAKPSEPASKTASAPARRKEDEMPTNEIAPAVKTPHTGQIAPGVKPPQGGMRAMAMPVAPTLKPGVKPPQAAAASTMVRPVKAAAPGVKPPQATKTKAGTVKAIAAKTAVPTKGKAAPASKKAVAPTKSKAAPANKKAAAPVKSKTAPVSKKAAAPAKGKATPPAKAAKKR